jgi:hypothetical protein
MFLFWIIGYLWLDVRFLLYLVPAWLVYSAKAIEDLDLIKWLRFRNKTPIHKVAIIVAIYFGLSLSAIRLIGFESYTLPLTPQMNLRFSAATPIIAGGVGALTTDKITTEYIDTDSSLLTLVGYFKFYKSHARGPKSHSDEFSTDVEEISKIIATNSTSLQSVGLCGDLGNVYETKMRIFFTIARNIAACSTIPKFIIALKKDLPQIKTQFPKYIDKWQGSELTLLEETNP